MHNSEQYKEFQVTIFEGEMLDYWGSDGEEMAICEETIIEIDALPVMKTVIDAWNFKEIEGEITEEQYMETLNKIDLGLNVHA